jgi:hypothetical protein
MNITEKARIAAEIKAFKNTDFSDCPPLTEEQLTSVMVKARCLAAYSKTWLCAGFSGPPIKIILIALFRSFLQMYAYN